MNGGTTGTPRYGLGKRMGYIDTIITGLAVFPFLAALFTLPYTLFQYHSHGSVS